MTEPNWKTIKAPRTLYLPTGATEFDNSGIRVEPTDTIRVLPGTNRIEINGVEHRLMIPCDNLRTDDNGVIQLNKPAPPVKLSVGGNGWAVGRMGEAVARSRGTMDQREIEDWQGDHATVQHPSPHANGMTDLFGRPSEARGFKIVRDETPAFGHTAKQVHFDRPTDLAVPSREWSAEEQGVIDEFFSEFEAGMADPNFEMREVTLRDGSKAQALFHKVTGQQVGTPQRMYQARYDDQGRQLSAPAPTHGPKATFDMDEYRRRLREQMADSEVAPSLAERYEQAQPVHQKAAHQPQQRPDPAMSAPIIQTMPEMPAAATGSPHLDDLLFKKAGTAGWPLGSISLLFGSPEATRNLLERSRARVCDSIPAAFGHIHLLKTSDAPLVAIILPDAPQPTDALRLDIAEQLPVLDNMIKGHRVAALIVAPDWDDATMPALLKFMPKVHVHVGPHPSDDRFVTAQTLGQTLSFPR